MVRATSDLDKWIGPSKSIRLIITVRQALSTFGDGADTEQRSGTEEPCALQGTQHGRLQKNTASKPNGRVARRAIVLKLYAWKLLPYKAARKESRARIVMSTPTA